METNEKETMNRIDNLNQYRSSIYSSSYNPDFYEFQRYTFQTEQPYRNRFMQSASNRLKLSTSVVYFTPASALSFMVFCLLYTPCVSTMAVLGKEIGKKWTIICILMQFVIAYITAMITFGLFNLIAYLGIVNSLFLILLIICIVHILRKLLNKKKSKIVNVKCMGCNRCK